MGWGYARVCSQGGTKNGDGTDHLVNAIVVAVDAFVPGVKQGLRSLPQRLVASHPFWRRARRCRGDGGLS
jgi:hypothetical protein